MFGFQELNTVVASSVFFFFSQFFAQSRHSWYAYGPATILNPDPDPNPNPTVTRYAYGSAMILNVLFGDLLVINLGIDLGRPDILISRHVLAQRTHTQREM